MESWDRTQRRELVETIEKQKATIAKHKSRMNDVVAAYKGLLKEKEALEASLKVFMESNNNSANDDPRRDSLARRGDDVSHEGDGGDVDDAESLSSARSSEAGAGAEARMRTLMTSLATLTEEKNKVEASFHEDRRRLITEKKELVGKVDAIARELEQTKAKAKTDLEEVKSKLIIEKHGREKDASDHQLMIRELQKLLSDERRSKEKMESTLADAQDKMRALEVKGVSSDDDRRKLTEVERKLKEKNEETDRLRKKLMETSPELDKLKSEMNSLKVCHRRDLDAAERKAEHAEARAASARVEQEQRVTNLEARLQELSDTVGTYDRLRQHDQQAITRLKEKIEQLSQENRSLSRASSESPKSATEDSQDRASATAAEDGTFDLRALLEKYREAKRTFLEANRKAKLPVDLEEEEPESPRKAEIDRLRKEVEMLKKQSSSASSLASRYFLPEADQDVVVTLRAQVTDLQDRLSQSKRLLAKVEEDNATLTEREKELRETLAAAKQTARAKMEEADAEYRAKTAQLEEELQKQRERCITLIEEKEDEVSMLKANMELAFENSFSPDAGSRDKQLRAAATSMASGSVGLGGLGRKRSVEEMLPGPLGADNSGMMLHYVQEVAHRDVEIASLRTKVHEVECALRELQLNAVAKEERYVDEIDAMHEQMARLKRMAAAGGSGDKEGVNLEYLKNVVLRYMLSSDASSREHMLKAIAAVLIFSSVETKRVRDYNASWWPSAAAAKGSRTATASRPS